NKLRIISVYLQSENNTLSIQTQEGIAVWLSQKQTPLFKTMGSNNLLSVLTYFDINASILTRGNSSSKIDNIWIMFQLIALCTAPTLTLSTENISCRYDKMDKEAFTIAINRMLEDEHVDVNLQITDSDSLNKQWHKLNAIIKKAA
ncbi:3326_t:CDS:2, partial [Gigaspora rosea]